MEESKNGTVVFRYEPRNGVVVKNYVPLNANIPGTDYGSNGQPVVAALIAFTFAGSSSLRALSAIAALIQFNTAAQSRTRNQSSSEIEFGISVQANAFIRARSVSLINAATTLQGNSSVRNADNPSSGVVVSFTIASLSTARARATFVSNISFSTTANSYLRVQSAASFNISTTLEGNSSVRTGAEAIGAMNFTLTANATIRATSSATLTNSVSFTAISQIRLQSSATIGSLFALTGSSVSRAISSTGISVGIDITGSSLVRVHSNTAIAAAFNLGAVSRLIARSTAASSLALSLSGSPRLRSRSSSSANIVFAIIGVPVTSGGTPVTYGTPSSGFVQSPTGTYSGSGYAVAAGSLAAGADALYDTEWSSSQNSDVVIGISDNNTNNPYTNYAFGVFVYSATGTYSYTLGSGSIINTGTAPAAGDRPGIKITNRATSATYVFGYTRGGVWVPLYTNTAITGVNVTIYFKADIAGVSSKLLNPKLLSL